MGWTAGQSGQGRGAAQCAGAGGVDLPKGGGDVAQMCPGEGVRAQV